MIRYLKHKEIDKKKWDKALESSRNRMVYACSWYLDIVCPGWDALAEDDYTAIMPLTAGKKYGISYLYPPFFTQQSGIFSSRELSAEDTAAFLAAIPAKFKFAEINLNSGNVYSGKEFTIKKNLNHELDLSPPYEKLGKGFSKNCARNIKKAWKSDLHLDKDTPFKEVIQLFRSNRGVEVKNLKDKHYATLKTLASTLLARKSAQVWGVSSNGRPASAAKQGGGELLAGALFIEHFGRTIFIFSGMSEAGKKAGAMFFLLNEYFKAYSGSPIVFDFEGSNDADLTRFYRSFGSKECVYLQVRRNSLPKALRWLKN